MKKSIVISVNTIAERDLVMQNIQEQLESQIDSHYIIQKDRVNRIQYFYKTDPEHSYKTHIATYVVVVLPIILDLEPLHNITGEVSFHLDSVILKLTKLTKELTALRGTRIVKENTDTETFEQLIRCLA